MIAMPNMEKPKNCQMCFNLKCDHFVSFGFYEHDCPLIEIVRCGECARRKKNGFCLEHNRYERNDDNFCSYGERRADGDI